MSEARRFLFYGETGKTDDNRLDFAINIMFNQLKKNTVIDAEYVEKVFWERIEQLNRKDGLFTSDQMEEAYRDGYENDYPNTWGFDIEDYKSNQ